MLYFLDTLNLQIIAWRTFAPILPRPRKGLTMPRKQKPAKEVRSTEAILSDLIAAQKDGTTRRAARARLEAELITSLGFESVEGGAAYEVGDHTVVVIRKIPRKVVDLKSFVAACEQHLPPDLRPYQTKSKISETALRYLSKHEPKLFEKISDYVVMKPTKTEITIHRTRR
jgi:hypothetical protein